MKLLIILFNLFCGLPDLGLGTHPTGIQLDGNVKRAEIERPAAR